MAEGTIKIKEMEELTELTDNDYFVVDNLQSGVPTKKYKATRVIQMIENVADEIEEKITPSIDTALAVGSASGNIASFTDGSNLPMPKLQVGIEPQQDLHGYDTPWVGGAGKNKLPYFTAEEKNGIRLTYDNGVVILNGTASANAFFALTNLNLASGTYTFSANNTEVNSNIHVSLREIGATSDFTDLPMNNLNKNNTYQNVSIGQITLYVLSGTQLTNFRLPLQIEVGNQATTFAPYSNICPISGWDECNVSDVSANVWDEETKSGYYVVTTGSYISNANQLCSKDYISVRPNMTLYGYKGSYTRYGELLFYDSNHDYIGYLHATQWINKEFTIPSNCYYITFNLGSAYGATYNHDISINYPSTDTSYHAYNGNTYTIDLDGTRYGGTLDVVSGVLTVDRVMKTFSQLSIGYNSDSAFFFSSIGNKKYGVTNIISSCFRTVNKTSVSEMVDGEIKGFPSTTNVYWKDFRYTSVADFITNVGSQQVCYELATPLTYQLTPTQVKSLLQQNNVWADCGEIIDCEYKRDATAIINSLIARIEALENQ